MENKSSPVKKATVMWLPSILSNQFSDKLKILCSKDPSDENKFAQVIQELLNLNSIKHLDLLKQVTQNIHTYCTSSMWAVFIEIIVNGLYYSHSNHIIKSSINGVLRHLSDSDRKLITSMVEEKLYVTYQDKHLQMNLVDLLTALLQSDFGCQVITNSLNSIIKCLSVILNYFSNELEAQKPTNEIVQLHGNIHSLSRTLLSIIKLGNGSLTEDNRVHLLNSTIRILNTRGIPLDPVGNCAKILVLLVKLQPLGGGIPSIMSRMTDENFDDTQDTLARLDRSIRMRIHLSIALLSTLELAEFMNIQPDERLVISAILHSLLHITSDGLNDTESALSTIRLLEQWHRKCLDCFKAHQSGPVIRSALETDWREASDRLLDVAFSGLEHQIDVVRHTAKEALLLNMKINILLHNDVDHIVQTVFNIPRFKKSRYMALACMAKTEIAPSIILYDPNLSTELLDIARDPDLSSHAKEVYNLLVSLPTDNSFSDRWKDLWLYPLLDVMEKHPSNSPIFENWLIDLLKIRDGILDDIELWCQSDPPSRLSVYVSSLLACRRLGLDSRTASNKTDILQRALEHPDGKLRMNALHVIVEGAKTSRLYSTLDLEYVRRFIRANMDNPDAAFRQQMCSCVKKLLLRLRNGIEHDRHFVAWLVDECLVGLGPGSSFPRRFLSLQFLKLIHESVGLHLAGTSAADLSGVASLADCFFDSYDVNKELALELLLIKPLIIAVEQDAKGAQLMEFYWRTSLKLSQGLKSSDTVAAGFFLRWLVRMKQSVSEEQTDSGSGGSSATILNATNELLRMLKGQLDKAKGNLGSLAIDAPLYGLLSSIRLLIGDQNTRHDLHKNSWESTVLQVIEVSFEACAIASPVVTCDSPEGFLPPVDPSTAFGSVNAQALLVSAWRTVKEVALLFGQISAWMASDDDFVLTDDRILMKIGLHLKQLLLETKHRGAFEQVHCGFSQLVNALWRSCKSELNRLPSVWLMDIIDDLKRNESANRMCATRRSAGLPFIFQAVLSAEVELGRRELFDFSMESLLEIARGGDNSSSENRIHSLNILRHLYRQSRLNQVIGPYVGRGLIQSIAGFEALDWPERNSSTLLFSALVTRIFGVAKSKNDDHKKPNSLTGRVFFQLYPDVYPFLLERLDSIAADIGKRGHPDLHPSLFPMLVLLGRLQPPACQFLDSPFQLEPFVALVRQCGSSPVFKTRQLAARALTSLLTSSGYTSRLLPEILDAIRSPRSHNQLHGALLQIRCFLRDFPQSSETRVTISDLVPLLGNESFLIRYEAAEILQSLHKENTIIAPSVWQTVTETCRKELGRRTISGFYSQPFYPLACQAMARLLMPDVISTEDQSALVELFNHPLQEVKLEVMDYLERTDLDANADGFSSLYQSIVVDQELFSPCRAKALRLLVKTSPQRQLELCLTLLGETEKLIRCSALEAMGRIIHNSSANPAILVEWSRHLLEAVECGEVPFRLVVIESIARCFQLLIVEDHHQTVDKQATLVNMWTCLLRCLIDDDFGVRSTAAAAVSSVERSSPVHPTIAVERALEYLVNRVYTFHPTEVVTMLSQLVLDEEEQQPEGDSPSFEKGDSDAYWEPLPHSVLFCRYIGKCVQQKTISPTPKPSFDAVAELVQNAVRLCLDDESVLLADSLSSYQRFHATRLIKFFLLTEALAPVNQEMIFFNKIIRQRFEQLNHGHWSNYSVKKLVSST